MKKTVDKDMFRAAFDNATCCDHFSYEALGALFDHLTNEEKQTGEEIELDPYSICRNYTEYSSAVNAVIKRYRNKHLYDEHEDNFKKEAASLEWLYTQTVVIEVPSNSVIIQEPDIHIIIQDF
jgi:hypothetical protein